MLGVYTFLLIGVDGYVQRMSVALQDSASLTQRDAHARSIETFLNTTAPLRTALAEFVVKDEEVVFAIELLEDISRKEKVALSISSVSISTVPNWNYHERVDVSFSVDGTFGNITDFIATLEAMPFAVRLESGILEASDKASWFGSFKATFIKEKISIL